MLRVNGDWSLRRHKRERPLTLRITSRRLYLNLKSAATFVRHAYIINIQSIKVMRLL